jgi:hypothetical protein
LVKEYKENLNELIVSLRELGLNYATVAVNAKPIGDVFTWLLNDVTKIIEDLPRLAMGIRSIEGQIRTYEVSGMDAGKTMSAQTNPTVYSTSQLNPVMATEVNDTIVKPAGTTGGLKTDYSGNIKAASGFSGIIKKPTNFTVGEGYKSEYVNVTPVKDLANMANGLGRSQNGNIVIHEHIDLRGAYGISSSAVAEKVWKNVWAPARKKYLARYSNTKGKVIR